MNRRSILCGLAAATTATALVAAARPAEAVPKDEIFSSLSAIIEAHRSAQAAIDALNPDELDPPDFDDMCAREWLAYRDVNGYGPRTLEEARRKLEYLRTCQEFGDCDGREIDQLARSFLVEPGTIAEFRTEYPSVPMAGSVS